MLTVTCINSLSELKVREEYARYSISELRVSGSHIITVETSSGGVTSEAKVVEIEISKDDVKSNLLTRIPIASPVLCAHPTEHILTLFVGATLQDLDYNTQTVIHSKQLPTAVRYCKYLDTNVVAIVDDSKLYIWHPKAQLLQAVCDIHTDISDHEIIDVDSDSTYSWFTITAMKRSASQGSYKFQLYNKDRDVSQIIPAYATCLLEREGRALPLWLCMANYISSAIGWKLIVVSLPQSTGGIKHALTIPMPKGELDYPIALLGIRQASRGGKLLVVITRFGRLFSYDTETLELSWSGELTNKEPVLHADVHPTSGIIAVTESGKIWSVTPYVSSSQTEAPLVDLDLDYTAPDVTTRPLPEIVVTPGTLLTLDMDMNSSSPIPIAHHDGLDTIFQNEPIVPSPVKASPFSGIVPSGSPDVSTPISLSDTFASADNGNEEKESTRTPSIEHGDDDSDVPVIDTMELETKEQSKPTEVVQIRDTEIETLVKTCAIEELQNVIGLALAHHVYPNWTKLLEHFLSQAPPDIPRAAELFRLLAVPSSPTFREFVERAAKGEQVNVDAYALVDQFFQRKLMKEGTALALDALALDRPEDGRLQTYVVEENLKFAPAVAVAMVEQNLFSHYDKPRLARLFFAAGYLQVALNLDPSLPLAPPTSPRLSQAKMPPETGYFTPGPDSPTLSRSVPQEHPANITRIAMPRPFASLRFTQNEQLIALGRAYANGAITKEIYEQQWRDYERTQLEAASPEESVFFNDLLSGRRLWTEFINWPRRRQFIPFLALKASAEVVAAAISAFMQAAPLDLLELLDVLLHPSYPRTCNNTELQDLAIITAMKARPDMLVQLTMELNSYSFERLAEVLLTGGFPRPAAVAFEKAGKFETVVEIYVKLGDNAAAYEVASRIPDHVLRTNLYNRLKSESSCN